MKNLARLGRYCFAIALIASGLSQLILGNFVRLIPKFPAWIPWPGFWVYFTGVVLVILGSALATGKKARLAAVWLAILLFLTLVLLAVPQAAKNPRVGFMWTNPCKTLALLGGAILLAGISREENPRESAVTGAKSEKGSFGRWFAPLCLGLFFLVGGIQHFVYLNFVMKLVPQWLPGLRFWVCFTGVALIAAGAGLNYAKTARWAATLAGVMIFLWVPLVHLPRGFADLHNMGELSGVFEALALSGVAFLVAGTRSRTRPENIAAVR